MLDAAYRTRRWASQGNTNQAGGNNLSCHKICNCSFARASGTSNPALPDSVVYYHFGDLAKSDGDVVIRVAPKVRRFCATCKIEHMVHAKHVPDAGSRFFDTAESPDFLSHGVHEVLRAEYDLLHRGPSMNYLLYVRRQTREVYTPAVEEAASKLTFL